METKEALKPEAMFGSFERKDFQRALDEMPYQDDDIPPDEYADWCVANEHLIHAAISKCATQEANFNDTPAPDAQGNHETVNGRTVSDEVAASNQSGGVSPTQEAPAPNDDMPTGDYCEVCGYFNNMCGCDEEAPAQGMSAEALEPGYAPIDFENALLSGPWDGDWLNEYRPLIKQALMRCATQEAPSQGAGELAAKIWKDFAMSSFNGEIGTLLKLIREHEAKIIATQEAPAQGTAAKCLADLKNLADIQSTKGNYDCNEYMRGLANGLILAVATMENKEPNYIEPPQPATQEAPGQMSVEITAHELRDELFALGRVNEGDLPEEDFHEFLRLLENWGNKLLASRGVDNA